MITELVAIAVIIFTFVIGYITGMTTKGFHININHNHPKPEVESPQTEEVKQEFNQSTVNELPDEVRRYYEQNNGFIK